MRETKFLALMYLDNYVNVLLLNNGIYTCSKPTIYELGTTIKSLVDQAKSITDLVENKFVSDEYIKNLEKCKLVEIEVKVL